MAEIYKDPNSFGINKYAGRLQANNISDTGWAIVPASEIGGHRRVATLDDLKNLTVPILSENTTGNDAVGQLWYVDSEACFYQLISWTNRKSIAEGWKKFSAGGGAQRILPIDGVKETGSNTLLGLIKVTNTSAEDFTFSYTDSSGAPVQESFDKDYGIYFINKWNDPANNTATPHPGLTKHIDSVFVFGHKEEIGDDSYNVTDGAEGEVTVAPADLRLRHHYFTKFKNSDLYAYNEDVEQIFLDPTGQAWKYDEDGLNLIKTEFASAFTTKQDVQEIVDKEVAKLVDGAPDQLNTLKELADAVQENGGVLESVVPNSRTITGTDGLTGGGDLTANRTISIAANGVTTAKIADSNVTTAKIAGSAVTDAKIASNAVTTAKIAGSAVTDAKIASNAVTTAKIADANVTTAKIASNAVTTAKIAADAVSLSKVGGDARSMLSVNALKFYKVAEGEDVVGLVKDTNRLTSKISNFDIIFSPHSQIFVYAHKSYSNDDTTRGPEFVAPDASSQPDSAGQKYYTTFTFGNVSSEMYAYEPGVEKRYVDADGDYWVWASNGKELIKATETVASDALDTLSSSFETLNSTVMGDARNLVSPTISATFTVYTNGVAGTPQTISSNPGAIFAGQTASLTSATFKYNAGTTYRKPVSCSGDWSTLPADNTNSSAISIENIDVTNYSSDAKKLSVTLSAPKVGLMVSGTKVVPASGNDTTSKSIAVSYKYRIFSGAFTKDPASLTADDIKALTAGEGTSKGKTFTINVDNSTRYAYAYPKSWGAPSISKGVEDQSKFWSNKTVSITTSEGWTADYYVYYTTGPGAYSGDSIKFA